MMRTIRCILGNFEGSSWKNIRNQANDLNEKIKQDMNDKIDDDSDVLHHSDKIMRTTLFAAFLLSSGVFAAIMLSDKFSATSL